MENSVTISLAEYDRLKKREMELDEIVTNSKCIVIYGDWFSTWGNDAVYICSTKEDFSKIVQNTIDNYNRKREYSLELQNELKTVKSKWWYKLFKNL